MLVREYFIDEEPSNEIHEYDSKIIKYYFIGIPLVCYVIVRYLNYKET